MSKYIIDTETWANLFEVQRVGVYGIGNDIVTDEKTVWSRMFRLDELEELNSDYINEHYGELQDEAYQRGHDDGYEAGCATAFKPVSDAEYQRGYDEGYKKCLSENDFDQPCVSCDDYQRGLNDAWEAAKKIMNMSDPPYWDVFGEYKNELFKKFSVSEAIAKLKAYEDKHSDRIEVGDEVTTETGKKYTVVSFGDSGNVCGFNTEGRWTGWNPKEVTKTGKHYDIQSILEAMRE